MVKMHGMSGGRMAIWLQKLREQTPEFSFTACDLEQVALTFLSLCFLICKDEWMNLIEAL